MSIEIESRAGVQSRISQPSGQTKGDRDDHLPLLILQTKKDLELIANGSESSISDMESLKGIKKVHGFQARVKEIRKDIKAIRLLAEQCNRMLLLTKNKSYTVDAERRYTVLEKTVEKRKEKRAIGLASIQNKPLPPKTSKEDSPRNEIMKLLKRLKNKEVQSPKSKVPAAVTPVKLQHLRSRSKELDYGAEIALSEDEKVRLDPLVAIDLNL